MSGPQIAKHKTSQLKNVRQSAFLKAQVKCGVITRAAVMAKIERHAHLHKRHGDGVTALRNDIKAILDRSRPKQIESKFMNSAFASGS